MTEPHSKGAEETLLSDRPYRKCESGQSHRSRLVDPPTTMGARQPIAFAFREGVIVLDPAPADWILPVLEKVCELGSLPPNWNSYGACPIRAEIAVTAVTMLLNLLKPTDPVPSIVPTCHGEIQLEWHVGRVDLEVEIRSPSRFDVLIEMDDDEPEEYDNANFDVVEEKLNVLRKLLN